MWKDTHLTDKISRTNLKDCFFTSAPCLKTSFWQCSTMLKDPLRRKKVQLSESHLLILPHWKIQAMNMQIFLISKVQQLGTPCLLLHCKMNAQYKCTRVVTSQILLEVNVLKYYFFGKHRQTFLLKQMNVKTNFYFRVKTRKKLLFLSVGQQQQWRQH